MTPPVVAERRARTRPGRARTRGAYVFLALLAALTSPLTSPLTRHGALFAQEARIRAQRDTLEKIRQEREELERRAAELSNSVHDLNDEVTNLDRRADATARLVRTLDNQLAAITTEVNTASTKLVDTQQQLDGKRAALRHRLVNIYKRGPLYTTEVMLSARSFGELVARYKYLHMLAVHDRALVTRVEQLHREVQRDHDRLVMLQTVLEENRSDKKQEEDRLRSLEQERSGNLRSTQRRVQQTQDRLAQLKKTESQLTSAITALEAERRRAESARPAATRAASTIKTSDYGKLDWPVDGALVYTFGKAQTASNTTIRWNGVGIKAQVGTAVHAVAAGKVVSVGQLGTYGLTVIIDHGGGDYSIYGSLSRADVKQQENVAKGQTIGGVGISDPDLPAHLHFEIRHGGADGRPGSVDPATWLRGER